MNDHELTTLVREQRTSVPMTTPVEEIIGRGRRLRARRRIPGVAGGLAVAASAAVAATVLVSGGHPAPAQSKTELAAWTVTKQANGDVDVTIRQLRDPNGLAAALRADGVPAYVAFADPAPAYCLAHPVSASRVQAIYQFHRDVLVINPSAIPSGAGLFIVDIPLPGKPVSSFHTIDGRGIHVGIVSASKECSVS